jgi:predicted nuclease of predicted toxin-antitoxin system
LKNTGLPLVVLLDEGVPIKSAEPFRDAGHGVIYHADVLSPSSSDKLVADMAVLNKACLIAADKDMKQMIKRFGNPVQGRRFKYLNLILVNCSPVQVPKRLSHVMSFIENEWSFCCQKRARSLWLDIDLHRVTSYR